jgi:hypothetical protein
MSTLQLASDGAAGDRLHAAPVSTVVNTLLTASLMLRAFWRLLFYDALCRIGFAKSYQYVQRCRRSSRTPRPGTIERVVWAVDEACLWYFKRVLCLQRSAVTTCLLRRQGVAAELVIGFRPVPMDSHAWVEVDGEVVNDRPQYKKFFHALDRL